MKLDTIAALLEGNAYPGRGIILGRAPDGGTAMMAYFIMGRSENSRNRVFEETGDGIRTRAFDESRMTDPSLVIYHPVRALEGCTIVTNGDQTDTIRDALAAGKGYIDALRTRCFEPDGPLYTPRVSGVLDHETGGYCLSILKSADGDPNCNHRFFFEYDAPLSGRGHLIHTYAGDGNPPLSFDGEPRPVILDTADPEALAEALWRSLDGDNKISLFVRRLDLKTGQTQTVIRNKYE